MSQSSFDRICALAEQQKDSPKQEEGWTESLQAFIHEFEQSFDLRVLNEDPRKKSQAIKSLTQLVIEETFDPEVRNAAIQCLKIISRSREHLNTLYTSQLIQSCLQLSNDEAFEMNARVEALKLLLNLTILDATEFQSCASRLAPEDWVRLSDTYHLFDQEGQYIICRLLQFSALDPNLRREFADAGVYRVVVKTVFSVLEPLLEAPLEEWDREETHFSRKLLWEAMKAIINFSLSATTPEQNLGHGLGAELYQKLARLMFQLLGVAIDEVEDPPDWSKPEEDEEKSGSAAYTKKVRVVNPAEEAAIPGEASLWQLKQTAGNVVLCMDQDILEEAAEETRGVEGLVEILHTKTALYEDRRVSEQILPIMKALFEVAQANESARRYIKREIFGQYARPLTPEQKSASNLGMVPDGSPSEAVLDEDPLSLRARLTPLLMHWDYDFKRSVGEFLYYICENETHDFLRLVGYGNGIGCLTDKGLPGFIGLRQQALDIDELLAQSYQGDKAKSGGKNADDTSVEPQNASGDLMGGVDDSGLELAENAEKPKEGADQEQDAERNQKAQKEPDQTPPSAAKEDGDSPHEE